MEKSIPSKLYDLDEDFFDLSKISKYQFPCFVTKNFSLLEQNLKNQTQSSLLDIKKILFICDSLIDYSWEMLNTNLWVFVEEKWRLVYGFATLYKILFLKINSIQSLDLFDGLNKKTIKLCDLGLLMTGSLLEKQFNQIINHIQKHEQEVTKPKKRKIEMPSVLFEIKLNEAFLISYEDSPSLETFKNKYFLKNIPVIIDNQMSHWPAMQKWSLEYIIELAGDRTVPIEIGSKYTDTDWSQKLMTIRDFINEFIQIDKESMNEKGYLAQHPLFNQIPELKEDIYLPEYIYYLSKDDEVESNTDINAWFGPCGTISPLHYDPKPNFLCQVIGEKYIRLYDEKYSNNLYPNEGNILRNTSQIDVENIDESKFPLAKDLPYWEGILKPGQMLFIPPKCWHYIRSLSLSFSVSFWWD